MFTLSLSCVQGRFDQRGKGQGMEGNGKPAGSEALQQRGGPRDVHMRRLQLCAGLSVDGQLVHRDGAPALALACALCGGLSSGVRGCGAVLLSLLGAEPQDVALQQVIPRFGDRGAAQRRDRRSVGKGLARCVCRECAGLGAQGLCGRDKCIRGRLPHLSQQPQRDVMREKGWL
jgi:hypothetical protein